MTLCLKCNHNQSTHFVTCLSLDYSAREEKPMCIFCLKHQGLYCEKHNQPHIVKTRPGENRFSHVCSHCVLVEVRELPEGMAEYVKNLLERNNLIGMHGFLHPKSFDDKGKILDAQNVLYRMMLLARLEGLELLQMLAMAIKELKKNQPVQIQG